MTDPGAAWLRFQIQAGETALVMRQAGTGWRQIADELRLGDETSARRAAALALSADLASRRTAGESAGESRNVLTGSSS